MKNDKMKNEKAKCKTKNEEKWKCKWKIEERNMDNAKWNIKISG